MRNQVVPICAFILAFVFATGCQTKQPTQASATNESGEHRAASVDLFTAASLGELAQVKAALQQGSAINSKDKDGKTALHYAAHSKSVDVVRFLVQQGADVNAKAPGDVTPLMMSLDMAFGDPPIAMELINAGADVSAADAQGNTALMIATTESSDEVFQALLAKHSDPNAQDHAGQTALHRAAMNALYDRAKLLLRSGAKPSIRDQAGVTPADLANPISPDPAVRNNFARTKALLQGAPQRPK